MFLFLRCRFLGCGGGGSGVSTLTATLLRDQLHILRAELSDRNAILRALFGGTSIQFSAVTAVLHSQQQGTKVPVSSILISTSFVCLFFFLIIAILVGVRCWFYF